MLIWNEIITEEEQKGFPLLTATLSRLIMGIGKLWNPREEKQPTSQREVENVTKVTKRVPRPNRRRSDTEVFSAVER